MQVNSTNSSLQSNQIDIGSSNLSDYLTKSELKPHLYAMICGIGPRQTKANLTQEFGKEISEAITSNQWWNELGVGCEQWRKSFMQNNKATAEEARTAMSLKCAEIEQELMKEVYVVSKDFPRVQIVSAEHDGCSVVCSNESHFNAFMKRCNEAITAKAATYKMNIKLVHKAAVEPANAPPLEENDETVFDYTQCDF